MLWLHKAKKRRKKCMHHTCVLVGRVCMVKDGHMRHGYEPRWCCQRGIKRELGLNPHLPIIWLAHKRRAFLSGSPSDSKWIRGVSDSVWLRQPAGLSFDFFPPSFFTHFYSFVRNGRVRLISVYYRIYADSGGIFVYVYYSICRFHLWQQLAFTWHLSWLGILCVLYI